MKEAGIALLPSFAWVSVDHDTAYTSNETHDTSQHFAYNSLFETDRFVSIVQYERTSALLPVHLVASSDFDSKTICLITTLQYVLHRRLTQLQQELHVQRPEVKLSTKLRQCPCCQTGTLVTIEVFGKRGPPQQYVSDNQYVPVG